MKKPLIGVMGPGDDANTQILSDAHILGEHIAQKGWNLINGGRKIGVMQAVSKGAHEKGGFVIGILPDATGTDVSEFLDVVIRTDMGQARNNINVLSADVVISCGMNPGTASEVALALRAGKHIILLHAGKEAESFFSELGKELIHIVQTPEEAISLAASLLP